MGKTLGVDTATALDVPFGSLRLTVANGVKVLWHRANDVSSSCEKTTELNHLQMSEQRQHFFYFFKDHKCWSSGKWNQGLPVHRQVPKQPN